ncbi:hypothetical protein [Acinetobacter soli]|uniref:Uncharacterized protein n=1 Tax=Acinetobacter soli TaxID=487316 RepID=A0A1P8ENC9_9GAMM|nr:hypothetical protein [Acinetobacter soli]APV37751.1 hypothetical protein BEN76_17030 [Acinetobacter soli]
MLKKIPVYFSEKSLSKLQIIMGEDGKVSPTINRLLEAVNEPMLFKEMGFIGVEFTTHYDIPMTLEVVDR